MAASEWSRVLEENTREHASTPGRHDFDADELKKKVQRDCMSAQLTSSAKLVLFLFFYLLTGTLVFSATEGW